MGNDVLASSTDRAHYRHKVQRCLDSIERMLAERRFHEQPQRIGLELELNLIDGAMLPSMSNAEVLDHLGDPVFTAELGQHNLELNMPPRTLHGDALLEWDARLRAYLAKADVAAGEAGASLAMIGILPTLAEEHFESKWFTSNARYSLLNDEIITARGELTHLAMEGQPLPGQRPDVLRSQADSILPEAACTSTQLHLQVGPDEFAPYWNASQCLAGVQLAIGANSPFLLGKALWHETRIPLFLQSTDTRSQELKNQGVRPRVWFGEKWITSIFDLFEENVRYFPGLLTETDGEDPLDVLESGGAPQLTELRMHNGTVWRWNRPVYDVVDGMAHLRVENRVLPAGPTVADVVANAAFFYGAQRALAQAERPVWSAMAFQAAEENLQRGARDGMDAQLYWPDVGWMRPDELVLRVLLPLAYEGLISAGVSARAADRFLGIIEQRCIARRTGSSWQRECVDRLERAGADRESALRDMLTRYTDHMHEGDPVHTWRL
ncbi:glutamate--cysteine ligase family protein [Haloechinothrix halophila]|uniref:glutamate--cysteine ligase n=1 Tax=Haloechinothrix halophila TaxID=1069073 RepID=UPI000405A8DD|nr:glutamate--cysteine ligase [Haloechinothrix halophila]